MKPSKALVHHFVLALIHKDCYRVGYHHLFKHIMVTPTANSALSKKDFIWTSQSQGEFLCFTPFLLCQCFIFEHNVLVKVKPIANSHAI
jgi:hypothetical protein